MVKIWVLFFIIKKCTFFEITEDDYFNKNCSSSLDYLKFYTILIIKNSSKITTDGWIRRSKVISLILENVFNGYKDE